MIVNVTLCFVNEKKRLLPKREGYFPERELWKLQDMCLLVGGSEPER